MLLNLSNHPLNTWTEKQIAEAKELYGSVVDLPFPQIPPEADENEVLKIADKYFEVCIEKLSASKDEKNAVHLMGELTFVFALANKLLHSGVETVASTTERNTRDIGNKKITEFNFVRFRKYLVSR